MAGFSRVSSLRANKGAAGVDGVNCAAIQAIELDRKELTGIHTDRGCESRRHPGQRYLSSPVSLRQPHDLVEYCRSRAQIWRGKGLAAGFLLHLSPLGTAADPRKQLC